VTMTREGTVKLWVVEGFCSTQEVRRQGETGNGAMEKGGIIDSGLVWWRVQ
jgi:hypothetical protein